MSHPSKAKGDAFERAVRDHLIAAGFDAQRTRAGYARDHGDVHVATGPAGPAVVLQAKAVREWRTAEWLAELNAQQAEAGAEHGAVVVKRRGVADPGQSYAVLTLDALLALLAQAGYRDEHEDGAA